MMRQMKLNDLAILEEGYQELLVGFEKKPYGAPEGLRNIQRMMASLNPKVSRVKVDEIIDNRIIRKLDDSGFNRSRRPRLAFQRNPGSAGISLRREQSDATRKKTNVGRDRSRRRRVRRAHLRRGHHGETVSLRTCRGHRRHVGVARASGIFQR